MSRHFPDWLTAFCDYASYGEAPRSMYFWTGVSTIAGCLRRRVWIDQAFFTWYPNFYIILVAPPGIVSKSTTANTGISLLKEIPGIHFGPDVVTSQALVSAFAECTEFFEYDGQLWPMSALTLSSGEFGNLLNPQDKVMVDTLVTLWDGVSGLEKRTKMSGNDSVNAPWINMIACTTPSWIQSNFPDYMIGGGLVSRMVFVYADKKAQYVAYPGLNIPKDFKETKGKLIADLQHIADKLVGPYSLHPETVAWGEAWYENHYKTVAPTMDQERFGGYIARKQTHIHKLAMVLAASRSDSMVLQVDDLATANMMVTDLETEMNQIFRKIGQTDEAVNADKLLTYLRTRKKVSYQEAYKHVHMSFPGWSDFENVLAGAINSGQIEMMTSGNTRYLIWAGD